jgi:hypothetical protein
MNLFLFKEVRESYKSRLSLSPWTYWEEEEEGEIRRVLFFI